MPVKAWADTIFGGANLGLVAPLGSELSADVNGWKQLLDSGAFTRRAEAVLDNAFRYHGVASLSGTACADPVPGRLDGRALPGAQALAGYGRCASAIPTRRSRCRSAISATARRNHPLDVARFDREGIAFLDAWLLR